MTFNAKIKVFMDFFCHFGLRDTFQERIAPKSIETDINKLHIKFLAFNVDFEGLNLDFLGLNKPAHKGIKKRYSRKSRYFTVVGLASLSCKRLQITWACCLSQQALMTSFLHVVLSRSMTLKDPEFPK